MVDLNSVFLVVALIITAECQTIIRDIYACADETHLQKNTELITFDYGSAYHLKTPKEGIILKSYQQTASVQGCSYALSLPKDAEFDHLSIFIKKAELSELRYQNESARLSFYGDKDYSHELASTTLSFYRPSIINMYVNTKSWKLVTSVIYMFITYFPSQVMGATAHLHLKLTLTPTYTCIVPGMVARGSYRNTKTTYSSSWKLIEEFFHPGWILCENSVNLYIKENIWLAPCINFHLYCDSVSNCPSYVKNANGSDFSSLLSAKLDPADEEKINNVCYPPLLTSIPFPFIIFFIASSLVLLLAIYLRFMGIYSSLLVLSWHDYCKRFCSCFCCSCPDQRRSPDISDVSGIEIAVPSGSVLSLQDVYIPHSPPTYSSLEHAQTIAKRVHRCFFCCNQQKELVVDDVIQSGNSLPPEYLEVTDQVGVYPETIVLKLKSLRDHAEMSIDNKKQETGFKSKKISTRGQLTRARSQHIISSGLSSILFWSNNRRSSAVRDEAARRSQLLPTYAEFIHGNFQQTPIVYELDVHRNENQTHCSNAATPEIGESNEIVRLDNHAQLKN